MEKTKLLGKTLLELHIERHPTIRNVIEACGSVPAAASAARVTTQTVYNWLAGRTDPKWHHFIRLCKLAKINPLIVEHESDIEELKP